MMMVVRTEKIIAAAVAVAAVWLFAVVTSPIVVRAAEEAAEAAAAANNEDDDWWYYGYASPPRPGQAAAMDRAAQSVETMMELYDPSTGRWQSAEPWFLPDNAPWWQSGNALQALLDFVHRTRAAAVVGKEEEDDEDDDEYIGTAQNTIRIQRQPLPWFLEGGGEFRASSTDDTGWWALALCRLYDLTQNATYLEIAAAGEAFMRSYWNETVCDGGIWWDVDPLRYKTAISNSLLLKLQASLHNRLSPENNDQVYLQHALETWNWFNQSGLINQENLVNDRLTDDGTCQNNRDTTWTYNQGVLVGALVELYLATDKNNTDYIDTARNIADAVLASPDLSPNGGILTEPCEIAGRTCNQDQASFKGIFVRNLAELNDLLEDSPYQSYMRRQAFSLYVNGRNGTDHYGLSWAGPFDSATFSISTQVSAVSLLTAVIVGDGDNNSNSSSTTITLPPPAVRFTPWSLLDNSAREAATAVLGYDETTWNLVGTAAVESLSWNALTPQQQMAATEQLGFDDADGAWNCYQNHYVGFDWEELAAHEVQEYWAILGYTADTWSSRDGDNLAAAQPATALDGKTWDALTPRERAAARDLCFFNYTWRGGGNPVVPLTEWPARRDGGSNVGSPNNDNNATAAPSASPPVTTNTSSTAAPTTAAAVVVMMPAASPTRKPEETAGPTTTEAEPPATAMPPASTDANGTTTLSPSAAATNDGSFESTPVPPVTTTNAPSGLSSAASSRANGVRLLLPSTTATSAAFFQAGVLVGAGWMCVCWTF